jgi:hypothetical protein
MILPTELNVISPDVVVVKAKFPDARVINGADIEVAEYNVLDKYRSRN